MKNDPYLDHTWIDASLEHIWIGDPEGPVFVFGYDCKSLADTTLERKTQEPDETGDMTRNELIEYRQSVLAGIELFERWAAELRSDLPQIEAALKKSNDG